MKVVSADAMTMDISIGIMAYNEEANIGRLLESILLQRMGSDSIKEIFVVSSGCTDRTEDIVKGFMAQDSRIRLLIQERREGKASAINYFLSKASAEILILESADTIPEEGTYERLVAPFKDSRVGMTGARPVPVNSREHFVGFVVQLMWSLHHKIALMSPKLGELVAFRNLVRQIPQDTAVDEASIEAVVLEAGLELRYVPEAVVRNKGPENIRDFLKQRRRIASGHLRLAHENNYVVSTFNPKTILSILIQEHCQTLGDVVWILGAMGMEFIGRLLGFYDYIIMRKNPYIWEIAVTTKIWD